MSLAIENSFKIGQWTVDPQRHLLFDDNSHTQSDIAPSLMALLCYLANNHGKVISRDELITHVWQGNVVSDESVSRSIAFLRKSLGDSAKSPRYIKTISKQGYQFLLEPKSVEAQKPIETPQAPSTKTKANSMALAGLFTIIILSMVAVYFIWPTPPSTDTAPKFGQMHKLPLSSQQNINRQPRFSPDGRFVISTEIKDRQNSLILRDLTSGSKRVLFSAQNDRFVNPTFSPTSEDIAFAILRRSDEIYSCDLMIYTFKTNDSRKLTDCGWMYYTNLSFSSDGKTLVATQLNRQKAVAGLIEINVDSGQIKKLVFPPKKGNGYLFSRLSPSNQKVAFVLYNRNNKTGHIGIYHYDTGQVTTLAPQFNRVQQVVWGATDQAIYFSDKANTGAGIWHLNLSTQKTTFVYNELVKDFDVDPATGRFVANINMKDINIHVAELQADGTIVQKTLINSIADEQFPALSHDATRLAYVANHGGFSNVWVKNLKTNKETQLTHFKTGRAARPKWARDGKKMAFIRTNQPHNRLHVIDAHKPDKEFTTIEHVTDVDWHDSSSQLLLGYSGSGSENERGNAINGEIEDAGVYLYDLASQSHNKLLNEWVYAITTVKKNHYLAQKSLLSGLNQVYIENGKARWQSLPGPKGLRNWNFRDGHLSIFGFDDKYHNTLSVTTLSNLQNQPTLEGLIKQPFDGAYVLDSKNRRFYYDRNDSKRMDLFLIEPLN